MKKYISIEDYLKNEKSFSKNNKNKILWQCLKILCLIVFLISLYKIFKWNIDNIKIHKINKEINPEIKINNSNDNIELFNPPSNKKSNYYYYITFPLYEINFSNFLNKNSDTVAFIHMNNTLINYPIVKTNNNNNYYLNHSFDNKKNNAGWIFMDYRNNTTELDDNTIIYGHSRLDGTLFGTLRKVLDSSWQDNPDNYVIYFSTLKENMLFQIFSIYTINSESYYITPNFINTNDKQKWLDTMIKRNKAKIETDVNVKDKILTLSTCQNTKGGRIVIHAKLIKKKKI